MRKLQRTLDRPVVLVVIGIGCGLLIHHITSAPPPPTPAPRGSPEGTGAGPRGEAPPAPTTGATAGDAPETVTGPTETGPAEPAAAGSAVPDAPSPAANPGRAGEGGGPDTGSDGIVPDRRPEPPPPSVEGKEPAVFREIWAYLYRGEEERWSPELPVTDLCLFNFSLDEVGRIEGRLDPSFLSAVRRAGVRAHVVVASSGKRSLFHFLLEPRYGERERILADIVALAERHPADGLQLDFEGLRTEEREHLVSFVRDLRERLPPGRVFSLALPAKTERSPRAWYYGDVRDLADRFVIMVYDYHWRGGPPGAVSPGEWHDRVVSHALDELPRSRVVIGLPFYGRIWQTERVARATRYDHLAKYLGRDGTVVSYDEQKSHRFTFREEVPAEGWFDDAASLYHKLRSARAAGIEAVGFWRLGQEDPRIWKLLRKGG